MKTQGKISVVFEFNVNGNLKAIFFNAETDRDQAILERSLNRIIKPSQFEWLRRLFRK